MTARLRAVPAPLKESPEDILRSLQVTSGMKLEEHGLVESLEPELWNRLRRETARPSGPERVLVRPPTVHD